MHQSINQSINHLCNQFNHVLALLISMSRFKNINFDYQIKLLLQKKNACFLAQEVQPPDPRASGG